MLTVLAILGFTASPWLATRTLDWIRHKKMRRVHARLGQLQIPARTGADRGYHSAYCPCVSCVEGRWQMHPASSDDVSVTSRRRRGSEATDPDPDDSPRNDAWRRLTLTAAAALVRRIR